MPNAFAWLSFAWLSKVLLAIGVFIALLSFAYSRHLDWLDAQASWKHSLITQGLHPLSIQLGEPSLPRAVPINSLEKTQTPGSDLRMLKHGLRVQSRAPGVLIHTRLNGTLKATEVSQITIKALDLAAGEAKFSLSIYADEHHWIAALDGLAIDTAKMQLLREPERVLAKSWSELTHLSQIQVYVHNLQGRLDFVLQSIDLTLTTEPKDHWQPISRWPEQRLLEMDRVGLRAMPSAPSFWLSPLQSWIALKVGLLLLLSALWFQLRPITTKPRLSLILALGALLLPAMWLLGFDAELDQSAGRGGGLFVLSIAVLAMLAYLVKARTQIRQLASQRFRSGFWSANAVLLALLMVYRDPDRPFEFSAALGLTYLLFASLQQALLQKIILPSAETLAPPFAVIVAATIFCLLHTPNFALMTLCFIAALGWCYASRAGISWLELSLSHALLGSAATACLSPAVLRNADVGVAYFKHLPL